MSAKKTADWMFSTLIGEAGFTLLTEDGLAVQRIHELSLGHLNALGDMSVEGVMHFCNNVGVAVTDWGWFPLVVGGSLGIVDVFGPIQTIRLTGYAALHLLAMALRVMHGQEEGHITDSSPKRSWGETKHSADQRPWQAGKLDAGLH